jgi:hypothetical protein
LKPAIAASLDRLREIGAFYAISAGSARCLEQRFAKPTEPGKSCRADYAAASGHEPVPTPK